MINNSTLARGVYFRHHYDTTTMSYTSYAYVRYSHGMTNACTIQCTTYIQTVGDLQSTGTTGTVPSRTGSDFVFLSFASPRPRRFRLLSYFNLLDNCMHKETPAHRAQNINESQSLLSVFVSPSLPMQRSNSSSLIVPINTCFVLERSYSKHRDRPGTDPVLG